MDFRHPSFIYFYSSSHINLGNLGINGQDISGNKIIFKHPFKNYFVKNYEGHYSNMKKTLEFEHGLLTEGDDYFFNLKKLRIKFTNTHD